MSRPVRGAWIETSHGLCGVRHIMGRAPCGARGLKLCRVKSSISSLVVAPRAGRVD